ncbi:MAG: metallophosphoesterase [Thermodesulfobacteriota bacterium]
MNNEETPEKSHVILHLSDLHFGWDGDEGERTNRELALNGLIEQLLSLETEWKPDILCITGDIGWKGQKTDYDLARQWIESLLHSLMIPKDAVFFSPGNHDSSRVVTKRISRPSTVQEADEILAPPNVPNYLQEPFDAFVEFLQLLGIPPYLLGETESYLQGLRRFGPYRILCLNSAWFSKGDDDRGKLWIGLPLLQYMERFGQLPLLEKLQEFLPMIVLLHHPREWLADAEINGYGLRKNTSDYVCARAHLVLTGHTHGAVRKADKFTQAAWHLSGGAAFNGAGHFNSFRLIRIERNRFVYRSFEFDPRSVESCWTQRGEAESLSFSTEPAMLSEEASALAPTKLENYREKSRSDALRVLESKSRALKPFGKLPESTPLRVSVEVEIRPPRFKPDGTLKKMGETQRSTIPLFDAAREHRRTLLLGDLGSGKSTLAARFVMDTMGVNDGLLSCFVPARDLQLSSATTIKAFLKMISRYFSEQIAPSLAPLDFEQLLSKGTELCFVVDGLDEAGKEVAPAILNLLGALTENWPSVQVLAIGRPVELLGVNYQGWKLLSPARLTDEDRKDFFEKEAVADGRAAVEARELANDLLMTLKAMPNLYDLADTPLSVRLIFATISKGKGDSSSTLGDLLTEMIKARLGRWAAQDGKRTTTPSFESEFPDEEARANLLARLALTLQESNAMSQEEALRVLRSFVKVQPHSNEYILAREAIDYFRNAGLLVADEQVHFHFQPVFEYFRGRGLALLWSEPEGDAPWLEPSHWRIVSFAATVIRRQGLMEKLRTKLMTFVEHLLAEAHNTPAAAYIISESQDNVLAIAFIEGLGRLGPRPLWSFRDEEQQSDRAIAESIMLAARTGFDWFFSSYLDPRYPFPWAGSRVVTVVFQEWAALNLEKITDYEKGKLQTLVRPHVDTGTFLNTEVIPTLALLVPEAFEQHERLWHFAGLLGRRRFAEHAAKRIRDAFTSGQKDLVNTILLKRAGSIPVASLWMDLNNDLPPSQIVKTAVSAMASERSGADHQELIEACISRIGSEKWERCLRWYVFEDATNVAAGAAISLYNNGERHLALLGNPLLKALHDGGYLSRAEGILRDLVQQGGANAVRGLAGKIAAEGRRDFYGAHSGWWRILLPQLPSLGDKGPAVLTQCLGAIGQFLLPRYPEIRQSFRDLVEGPYGAGYQRVLNDSLFDPDPAIRHGAALILLIVNPLSEAKALEVFARSVSRGRWHSEFELNGFILSLPFGSGVLSYIKDRLTEFDSSAETFLMAVLFRNGVQLGEGHLRKLTRGLLADINLSFPLRDQELPILADPALFPYLREIVENGVDRIAQWAAEKILTYHKSRADLHLTARCCVLSLNSIYWWDLEKIEGEIQRLKTNPSYAEAIRHASEKASETIGKRPLIDIIGETSGNLGGWEDVVWRLLCDDTETGHEFEHAGLWLLDFGRSHPDCGKVIGKAAARFLDDPRVQSSRYHEMVHWLALLADEFVGLPNERIEWAALHGIGVHESAKCALIARLGVTPKGFAQRDRSERVPALSTLAASPVIASSNRLVELARDSSVLHPAVCEALEGSLLSAQMTPEDLANVSAQGNHGGFIANAISFVAGMPVDLNFVIRSLTSYWKIGSPGAENSCAEKLIRIWQASRSVRVLGNPTVRKQYEILLEEAIQGSERYETCAFASELLKLRGQLPPHQIPTILDEYGTYPGYSDHFGLGEKLAEWFATDIEPETQTIAVAALKRSISAMDCHPWEGSRGEAHNPLPFLLFPLSYWKLTEDITEESIRVFLRGLKLLLPSHTGAWSPRETKEEFDFLETLKEMEPLLSKTPKSVLDRALSTGLQMSDPTVRALARLFSLGSPI